jgi:hypothetical protein
MADGAGSIVIGPWLPALGQRAFDIRHSSSAIDHS